VAAATLGATTLPPEWSAVSWQAGSIVTHEGHLYRATQLAPGGHVPGASTRWERFDLPTVWDKPAPAPALALDDLTDVDATSPQSGAFLNYWAGRWAANLPRLDGLADVSVLSETPAGHVLTYTGTFWAPMPIPEPPVPSGVWKSWTGTQAQFDALPTKSPDVLYVVTG
jgi:hypothetical protein